MKLYEINTRGLGEYISDIQFVFTPEKVTSTKGSRVINHSTHYSISANNIICNDGIHVSNDCFIDANGNVTVISYIPDFKYFLKTNELSECYGKDRHLSCECHTEGQEIRYNINADLISYEDFEYYILAITDCIGKNLEDAINQFDCCDMDIENIKCDIVWKIKKVTKNFR